MKLLFNHVDIEKLVSKGGCKIPNVAVVSCVKMVSALLIFLVVACVSFITLAASVKTQQLDYDIVYVRYPNQTDKSPFVRIPQGEHPYVITSGADLMLLKKDGKEQVLVDCNECSVMDPAISLDGKTVYYSLIMGPDTSSAGWLYKIDLTDQAFKPIRLTFDNGFESQLYAGNRGKSKYHDQSAFRSIRDMSPIPLADGRLLFTSNRSALTMFNPGTDAVDLGSIQQLYVMDDHDGGSQDVLSANIKRLEAGTLHLAQHPMQLKDGRILFSSWQDAGIKFTYAMTNLMTVHPDGSNLQQFTEPHDHHKLVEHFITQLSDEQVVSALYYPSFDYGYGILMRYPIDPPGPDFLRGSIDQEYTYGGRISYREFDRKGAWSLTPHTTPLDQPAPNLSGKYSMPSATKNGGLLVAYSSGSVNYFGSVCRKSNACEALKSGIYLIPNAQKGEVVSPSELVKIKDDPNHNEIWPRAVLSYADIYGQPTPDILPSIELNGPEDPRILRGEASALVGSSSTYNREVLDNGDRFQSSRRRETHDGNWTIQGAEAGEFSNSDIYGIRIISSPSKPYTNPISKYESDNSKWEKISSLLLDQRLKRVVARHSSEHGERWEILGEFPLTNKQTIDAQGNPDSSWIAKIPAETPFFIQAIDKNGMTLISELTWRALKSGEKRVDCGGCHAHSLEALEFETTQAGKRAPISNVKGIVEDDVRTNMNFWDLTQGSVPVLTDNGGVKFIQSTSVGVEFKRDLQPILQKSCSSCHTKNRNAGSLILDGSGGVDPYTVLNANILFNGKSFISPQKSKYIRSLQARQSLLVWVAYGERLDGRTNATREDDIDFPETHPVVSLSSEEKKVFSRWVDLGGPIDFPQTEGFGYTEDYQLPVINISQATFNANISSVEFDVGFYDMGSGINWHKIKGQISHLQKDKPISILEKLQQFNPFTDSTADKLNVTGKMLDDKKGIFRFSVPFSQLQRNKKYALEITAVDHVGNVNKAIKHFTFNPN